MLRRILLSVSILTLSATSSSSTLISYQAQAQVLRPEPSGVITRPSTITKCYVYKLDSNLAQIQQNVYNQVNQYRASQGLAPLKLDACVNKQVQAYAQEMANARKLLKHQGLEQRGQALSQIIPHNNSYYYYENEYTCPLGCNGDPATSAVQGWLSSPEHLNNILRQTELTGIGVAVNDKGEYYFAQMFVHAQ
jgi:uncharacterized protein YkwD